MAKKRKLRKLGLLNPPAAAPIVEAEPVIEKKEPSRKKRKGLFRKQKDD